MPLAAANGTATSPKSSLIFSQEDRKIGSFFGVARRTTMFGATRSRDDRLSLVKHGSYQDRSDEVIGACIEVHRQLGPGLLESIYEECLCHELALRGLSFERQKPVYVEYKECVVDQGYRVDLIVEGRLLVEIKAVEVLLPIHAAQVVTYLRVARLEHGLLVNFNALTIRSGLRRLSRTPQSFRSSDLSVKKSGSF
jgi:GxxExxY protein